MIEIDWAARIKELEAENLRLTERVKRYREALEKAQAKQPEALAICRKRDFVFDGKGGRWEKLAFTFYTDLCEINSWAKQALEPGEGDKA